MGLARDLVEYVLPWSIDLIERFKDRWVWGKSIRTTFSSLSFNSSLPWSQQLIERFQDRWAWGRLSTNYSLPWNVRIARTFLKTDGLGKHCHITKSIPWSFELIEHFKDRWEWGDNEAYGGDAVPVWKRTSALDRRFDRALQRSLGLENSLRGIKACLGHPS